VEHAADAPVVVLSPHLDDAALSAWSVLRGPGDVTVVNVFAGIPAPGTPPRWDRIVGATDSQALVRARLAEDRDALAMAGRRPVNLDLLDAQYRGEEPAPSEIASAITAAVQRASALYAPAGIGGHRDHELVRDLAFELCTQHGIPLTLYADLPYAARFGWPAWVTGDEPDDALDPEVDWEIALAAVPVERDWLVPSVVVLDPTEAEAKLRVLTAYRTQFPALNRGPLGLMDHPRVLPYELSWRLDGPSELRNVS
jgi:LmbE family N-acetylglucosaminyl deacetylase